MNFVDQIYVKDDLTYLYLVKQTRDGREHISSLAAIRRGPQQRPHRTKDKWDAPSYKNCVRRGCVAQSYALLFASEGVAVLIVIVVVVMVGGDSSSKRNWARPI
jgi:hypothetical protein